MKNKKALVCIVLAVVMAVAAVGCLIYQAALDAPTEANQAARTFTYYGLPIFGVLTVIALVAALVIAKKAKK